MAAIHRPNTSVVDLDQLISTTLRYLEELGYTRGSRAHYAAVWRALAAFSRHTGAVSGFTPRLADRFLKSRGTSLQLSKRSRPSRAQKQARRAVRVLLEFQATGRFQRRPRQQPGRRIPSVLRCQLDRYEEFSGKHRHLRPATLATRRRTLTPFLAFLGSRGITSPGEINAASLSAYIVGRSRDIQLRSLATQIAGIRSFLRFLCMEGLVSRDLLVHARSLRFSKEHRLPPVWPPEAVEALLSAVDRASILGKRNYAIFLLACRMGLRAGDIRGLRLDDLCWPEARLTFTQQKSGRRISLPLDAQVGGALIDYLSHARPTVRHREVFLRVRAPFEPFSLGNSLRDLVDDTLRRARVDLPPGVPRGLHALRHTLATRLVRAGEPLETVAGILGHRSIETTRVYTHLDIESLRSVALDPEEVFDD